MTESSQSDEWLMGQVARSSQKCLEPLVRRYASSLLTYIERMVGDRHRAEELFQEVLLAVWAKRKTFKLSGRFRPWLFAIATNRCRAEFRRAQPSHAWLLDDDAPTAPLAREGTPVEAAVATETAALVSAAVAQLPPQQRAVVVLRNWGGLPFAEIAEITGNSEATARSHMHHALGGIRRYLEPRLKNEPEVEP
ncbi:MAG: RNA polymerase sigma factor [Planctomycetota bacterium]